MYTHPGYVVLSAVLGVTGHECERGSEIGLRRALGATRRHVSVQFLSEALLLSAAGGLAGVMLGAAVTAVYDAARGWEIVVPAVGLVGGIVAALVIGAVAGLYPSDARRTPGPHRRPEDCLMPTFELTRRARRHARRPRNMLLIVTALIAGAVVLAVVTRGNGAADGGELGPTVVAEPRDLATTLDESGSLQRSDEHTVAYAAALPSDEGNGGEGDGGNDDGGGGGNGDSGTGDSGNGNSGNGDSGNSDTTPAAFLTGPSGTG